MDTKTLSPTRNLQRRLIESVALASGLSHAQASHSLRQNFQVPSKETHPSVWWRFMDDHVSREGTLT